MSSRRQSWTGLLRREEPTSLLGLGKNGHFRPGSASLQRLFRLCYVAVFARQKKLAMFGKLCQRSFADATIRLPMTCLGPRAPMDGYTCSIGTFGHG